MPGEYRIAEMFDEQQFQQDETNQRTPVSAIISNHDGHTCSFDVPSFSNGITYNGVPYEHDAVSDNTMILVVQDENGTWWVLKP